MLLEQDSGAPGNTNTNVDLHIYLSDGSHFSRTAAVGTNLQDLLHAYGFPVLARKGQYDGLGDCHVRVRHRWQALLGHPSKDELNALSQLPAREEHSRLASYVTIGREMDGLEIELHPDGLVPQTYWVAG